MYVEPKDIIMMILVVCIVVGGTVSLYYENRHLNEDLEHMDLEHQHEALQDQYDGLLALIELCNPELIDEHGLPKLADTTADTPLFNIFGTEYDWSDDEVNAALEADGIGRPA